MKQRREHLPILSTQTFAKLNAGVLILRQRRHNPPPPLPPVLSSCWVWSQNRFTLSGGSRGTARESGIIGKSVDPSHRTWRDAATSITAVFILEETKKMDEKKQERQTETATLAGGCFWCLDAVFRKVEGVLAVESGYTGGTDPSPSYRTVCSGATGHAEAVRIRFDPDRISFQRLLDIFFTVHDPTTLNRQGADVGTQYRSEIFWHTPEQEEIARKYIEKLSGTEAVSGRKVVTALTSAGPFYPAEDYHQDYYARNTGQPYCQMVIRPKMEKFQKAFSSRSG